MDVRPTALCKYGVPKPRSKYADWHSAIKTYGGEGKSNQIKCLHWQIYDRNKQPLLPSEINLRSFNGQEEDPMQKHAIRVETYFRDRSLDEMSECVQTFRHIRGASSRCVTMNLHKYVVINRKGLQ